MREHLTAAAVEAMDLFSKGNGTNAHTVRRPNDFDMPLMLTLSFGDAELKERLSTLPRENWFQPDDQEYKPLADLFDVLRSFPVNKSLNDDAILKVLEENRKPQAQPWYRPWIQAMGEGLLAISNGNKSALDQAIQTLLKLHAGEANQGDWKYLVQGLMATWALVLRQFARESGIDVNVESPYLPNVQPGY
jgi:hypothetical protein